jgi:omega-amidase
MPTQPFSTPEMKPFKLACIQHGCPTDDVAANLGRALRQIRTAAESGANVVLVPEYATLRIFSKPTAEAAAEDFGIAPAGDFAAFDASKSPSATLRRMSAVARECGIWLFAGSYPERRDGWIYNTMPVFDPKGRLVATYAKTHLCDLPMMDDCKESDFISPGDDLINVETGRPAARKWICC